MYCPSCGTKFIEAAQFCFKCGGPLPVVVGNGPPVVVAPAAPAQAAPKVDDQVVAPPLAAWVGVAVLPAIAILLIIVDGLWR